MLLFPNCGVVVRLTLNRSVSIAVVYTQCTRELRDVDLGIYKIIMALKYILIDGWFVSITTHAYTTTFWAYSSHCDHNIILLNTMV